MNANIELNSNNNRRELAGINVTAIHSLNGSITIERAEMSGGRDEISE